MSVLKDREGADYDFKVGAKKLSIKGVWQAVIDESPIVNNFPPALKIGTLAFGQNVVLKDGTNIHVDILDENTPSIGSKVVVFEKAKTLFSNSRD